MLYASRHEICPTRKTLNRSNSSASNLTLQDAQPVRQDTSGGYGRQDMGEQQRTTASSVITNCQQQNPVNMARHDGTNNTQQQRQHDQFSGYSSTAGLGTGVSATVAIKEVAPVAEVVSTN
ncbi:hypothetical protein BV898_02182 [Hypsibius exemplaris]|uniref:Uncharacterized protein n=1 Tax=Hypsibius exemplaris TaxID=2072580 RepID=A0A1W0X991_HYPEX|nr:hypothetical protein BV898_02182 [Hypsibius exemplaris]